MKNKGELLATILKNYIDCCFFLHNTKDINVVEIIMNEGFIFENQLSYSTDRVNPADPIEVSYFLLQRKDYGAFTIIISIPKITFDFYTAISNKKGVEIEEIITIAEPVYNDNEELVFKLSPKHVLGYFNIMTSKFYKNHNWDPDYNNYNSGHPIQKTGKFGGK
jgi:hypothetical protein